MWTTTRSPDKSCTQSSPITRRFANASKATITTKNSIIIDGLGKFSEVHVRNRKSAFVLRCGGRLHGVLGHSTVLWFLLDADGHAKRRSHRVFLLGQVVDRRHLFVWPRVYPPG